MDNNHIESRHSTPYIVNNIYIFHTIILV